MTDRNTRQVAVSADTLRMLLQSAAQAMPAGAGAEFEQHLTAAVQEGYQALETAQSGAQAGVGRIFDDGLMDTIQSIFSDAHCYCEDMQDADLCERMTVANRGIFEHRQAVALGDLGGAIDRELMHDIWDTLAHAYEHAESGDDPLLCERINNLTTGFVEQERAYRAARQAARERQDSETPSLIAASVPVSLFEAIVTDNRGAEQALMDAAQRGDIIRLT